MRMDFSRCYAILPCVFLLFCVTYGDKLREFCQRKPTGNYVHPDDCGKFLSCVNGHAFTQPCPPTMLFDDVKGQCDWASNVDCRSRSPFFPSREVKHSTDDKKSNARKNAYETRSKNSRKPAFVKREEILNFKRKSSKVSHRNINDNLPAFNWHSRDSKKRNEKQSHKNTDRGNTASKQSPSLYNQENARTYDNYGPSSNNKQGGDRSGSRGQGDNKSTRLVLRPSHSEKHTFKATSSKNSDVQTNAKESKPKQKVTCSKNGLFIHPSDCTKYVQCWGGIPYISFCPKGLYFNPKSNTCGYSKDSCASHKHVAQKPAASNVNQHSGQPSSSSTDHRKDESVSNLSFEEQLKAGKETAKIRAGELLRLQAVKSRIQPRNGQRRGAFSAVQGFLGGAKDTKYLSLSAFQQLEALKQLKKVMKLSRAEMKEAMGRMSSPIMRASTKRVLPDNEAAIYEDNTKSRDVCPFPMNGPDNDCDPKAVYRTYDGTCNNMRKPLWGSSNRALARFLYPDYSDGVGALREAEFGDPLPDARDVSRGLFVEGDNPSHVHSFMHMTFGQFVDHDLTRTAVTKLSMDESGMGEVTDVTCGDSGCSMEGPENMACDPITVRSDDPDYGGKKDCLMFVRTQEVTQDDCRVGPREQLNQLTSYVDASNIYGNHKNMSRELRDLSDSSRGRLLTTAHPYNPHLRRMLPYRENKNCRDVDSTIQCFNAGDQRVNEQVGLASVHTACHRAHNVYEERLHKINPHWDGETLYQETRKIMGGVMQNIVYGEYIPTVLGPEATRLYGVQLLQSGYYDGYDRNVNADATNAFATAAFRFGHSQVGDFIRFANKHFTTSVDKKMSKVFRRPFEVYNTDQPGGSTSGVDAILLGMAQLPAEQTDRFFSKEITAHMFSEDPPDGPGLDLPAINIKRGRDHGLPAYNKWRDWCGFRQATSFDDLTDIPDYTIRRLLEKLYDDVRDLDLYTGGILEKNLPGATVGPTFACIIGKQFRNTRAGDRFWFERNDPLTGFTSDQLQEIRKASLAKIICLTLDDIDTIQPLVMLLPISEAFKTLGPNNYRDAYSLTSLYSGENNERRPCSEIPDLDLSLWKEEPSGYNNPSNRRASRTNRVRTSG